MKWYFFDRHSARPHVEQLVSGIAACVLSIVNKDGLGFPMVAV